MRVFCIYTFDLIKKNDKKKLILTLSQKRLGIALGRPY